MGSGMHCNHGCRAAISRAPKSEMRDTPSDEIAARRGVCGGCLVDECLIGHFIPEAAAMYRTTLGSTDRNG